MHSVATEKASELLSVWIPKSWRAEIDSARNGEPLGRWMREAIRDRLGERAESLPDVTAPGNPRAVELARLKANAQGAI